MPRDLSGAVIADVARRHDLAPQQLSNWIRAAKDGQFVLPADQIRPLYLWYRWNQQANRRMGVAPIAPWRPAGFIIAVNASERLAV